MILHGVRYDPRTGTILASVHLSSDAPPPLPEGEAWCNAPEDHAVFADETRWRVTGGALVEQAVVVLQPDAPLFPADGVAACTITLAGLAADCGVRVRPGGRQTVLLADPRLVLTSDVLRTFTIQVDDLAHWSAPVTVRAV
jgi:hypothetical protein